MTDPLAEVVSLLQPEALLSKLVSGAGAWSVQRSDTGNPLYCVILEGTSHLAVDGHDPIELEAGDFVLIPATFGFTMSGRGPEAEVGNDPTVVTMLDNEIRRGDPDRAPNARLLVGHFAFGSPDAGLLVSLLPKLVHIRGDRRLATIVDLVADEARQARSGRDMILTRLLEVLLIEALRSTTGEASTPGLLRGLEDPHIATALRLMHESPARSWTIALLAKEAALSRSAFIAHFTRAMGQAPIEYLLGWRMALAKKLLRNRDGTIAEIAERMGYSSASAFSVAFTRTVGLPPARYANS